MKYLTTSMTTDPSQVEDLELHKRADRVESAKVRRNRAKCREIDLQATDIFHHPSPTTLLIQSTPIEHTEHKTEQSKVKCEILIIRSPHRWANIATRLTIPINIFVGNRLGVTDWQKFNSEPHSGYSATLGRTMDSRDRTMDSRDSRRISLVHDRHENTYQPYGTIQKRRPKNQEDFLY